MLNKVIRWDICLASFLQIYSGWDGDSVRWDEIVSKWMMHACIHQMDEVDEVDGMKWLKKNKQNNTKSKLARKVV